MYTVNAASAFLSLLSRLFVAAFALNWWWEMAQMPAYVEMAGRSWGETWLLCTVATLGDAAVTLAAYGVGALAANGLTGFRRLRRAASGGWKTYAAATLLGAATAIIVEWAARAGSYWTYTDRMPVVPVLNVGLYPLLQLTLLVPGALGLAVWWNNRALQKQSTAGRSRMSAVRGSGKRRVLVMLVLVVALALQAAPYTVLAQTSVTASDDRIVPPGESSPSPPVISSVARYVDTTNGMTADEAVRYALSHNGELLAARAEVEAARSNVRQAQLRPNPMLDANRSEQIGGGDNTTMVSASLPLELGGRRAARVRVAERELEVRERLLADRERQLAAEVRAKFGAALAETLKLGFAEELLATTNRGYRLVAARVVEGRTAPLEQNVVLVEFNRVRSIRESFEGRVRVAMLELRNLIGMEPETPLRLRGSFDDLIAPLPPMTEAVERALAERPDLQAARAGESLAEAQIAQARTDGRVDASLTAGYQRMNFGFPVQGIDSAGRLRPVQDVFHSVTVGVSISLPVRNRNQGTVEAAVALAEAARRRREFAELTVRREVAAAYARYESAARAMEIFRVGVRGQADENLDVIRRTYELGSKTLLDYIAERRRFIEVESEYINALLETYQARVEIERAILSPQLITR